DFPLSERTPVLLLNVIVSGNSVMTQKKVVAHSGQPSQTFGSGVIVCCWSRLLRNVARCDCLPMISFSSNCHGKHIMPWRQCRLCRVRFKFQNVESGGAFRRLRYCSRISTRMI